MFLVRDFQTPTRSAVYGSNAMAATSHPQATLTAIETLLMGGNAVDAAVAAAGALAVVEPQMTGIGGDCFVLYCPAGGDVIAYNGSGRAPAAAEAQWYLDQGISSIAVDSPHAVTIPGAIEAWHRLVTEHGSLPFGELLEPAIELAENGHPVHPRVAYDWAQAAPKMASTPTAARIFLPGGKAPAVGDKHRQPELAATLTTIATEGPEAFYAGPIAEDMVGSLNHAGGLHTLDDFAAHRGEFVDPIKTSYRGYEVHECPPNGQGLVALQMLNILSGFDVAGSGPLDTTRLHLEAEAGRLAYRDRDAFLCDPGLSGMPIDGLLSEEYAAELRRAISLDRAMGALPKSPSLPMANTVYLCIVDEQGNAISFINSLFHVFGSGLVSDETGVLFHSRGTSFVIDDSHPNAIAPGKRPMHTIMPGMLTRAGRAVMPFGVMGGHYQPFGHAHVVGNILDFGLDVQAALDVPRIFHFGGVLEVESGVPADVADALAGLGHDVRPAGRPLGGGQAIWIDHDCGILVGGSDPRKDGCALGY